MSTFNLTAETTEEELTTPVNAARARLAALAANPDSDLEALLSATHEVWEQVAIAKARYEIVGCLKAFDGDSIQRDRALQSLFIAIMSRGADDRWSGRKNDARRAAHDAVLQELNDLRFSLIRGA